MNSVYLVYTPYHILTAAGLASLYDESDKKYLVIVSDFADADIFCHVISKWDRNPFLEIILLDGRYNISNETEIKRVNVFRKNVRLLKDIFNTKLKDGCNAFIYHDANVEGQIIAYLNYKEGGTNFYVEDGTSAYSNSIAPTLPFYKILIAKVVYGKFYENVRILGMNRYISKIMVFSPENVRTELRNKKIIKIPKQVLLSLNDNIFIPNLLKSYGIDQKKLDIKNVFIAAHSDHLIKYNLMVRYKTLFGCCITELKDIHVKYHPRERIPDFLDVEKDPKVKLIPQALPMEILYLSLIGREPKMIIGGSSTALLTAKILLKPIRVISLLRLLNSENVYLGEIFKKEGIIIPKKVTQLKKELKSHES